MFWVNSILKLLYYTRECLRNIFQELCFASAEQSKNVSCKVALRMHNAYLSVYWKRPTCMQAKECGEKTAGLLCLQKRVEYVHLSDWAETFLLTVWALLNTNNDDGGGGVVKGSYVHL